MSIADEINRIKNNIQNAYSECLNKGAMLPENQNSENLSNTISTITIGTSAKYGLSIDNIIGNIDENGELQQPISSDLIANGIKRIDNYMLYRKFCGYTQNNYNEGIWDDWDFENPEPTILKNNGIRNILFPDLVYIGNYALYEFLTYSDDLESANFPLLEEVNKNGMNSALRANTKLITFSCPHLKTLSGGSSLSYVCYNCSLLESVNLDKLENLSSNSLYYAFGYCTNLKEISFPALNINSFGTYTNQFDYMLQSVRGCTVHFPFVLEDIIGEWQSVKSGFNGTNTIILFDLHRAQLNFITNSQNAQISINNKLIEGLSGYAATGDVNYTCYDSDLNRLYSQNITLSDDEVVNIDLDNNSTTQKITLSTGVAGLDVYFKINGLSFKGQADGNGNYFINTNIVGKEINYFINGGNTYTDAEGVIITTGQNITINVSIKRATISQFTRPNLTSNGVLGGEDFAVVGTNSAGSQPYQAMDGTSSYWWASAPSSANDTDIFTFYNPKPIKLESLNINYWSSSTTYVASKITVEGSNDNSNWEELTSVGYVAGQTRNIEVNSNKFYKYHRILFVEYSVYLRITDIEIVGKYKE